MIKLQFSLKEVQFLVQLIFGTSTLSTTTCVAPCERNTTSQQAEDSAGGDWKDLPQAELDLAVLAFQQRLPASSGIKAKGGHFEHFSVRDLHRKTALTRAN